MQHGTLMELNQMVDQLKTVSVMRLDQATLIISCIMTSHVQRDSMLFVKYQIMLIIKWVSYIHF